MTDAKQPGPVTPSDQAPLRQSGVARDIPSEEILRGAKSATIVHEGERYRLLVTKNGKLLLQK